MKDWENVSHTTRKSTCPQYSVKLKFSTATKSKETLRIAIRMKRATEIFVWCLVTAVRFPCLLVSQNGAKNRKQVNCSSLQIIPCFSNYGLEEVGQGLIFYKINRGVIVLGCARCLKNNLCRVGEKASKKMELFQGSKQVREYNPTKIKITSCNIFGTDEDQSIPNMPQ